MKKSALERVQELAQKLSPEDRIRLWHFISDLPDSGIHSGNLEAPETTLRGEPAEGTNPDLPVIVSTETSAILFLKNREIFHVTFRPDNFRQSHMQIRATKKVTPSEEVKNQIQEIFQLHGSPKRTEEDIVNAVNRAHLEIDEAAIFRTSNEFAAKLKHLVWLLYDAGMKVVEIGWRNDVARKMGQRTMTMSAAIETLGPYWKEIKTHLSMGRGGRQNVKHEWSVRDHTCLAVHYDRLKPIWRGAKKVARQALRASDTSRRKNWKEQVAAAYKDEDLPADLIEQLAPSVGTQPAELALLHAARLCLPVTYSTRILEEKLRKFNPVPKTSRKTRKNQRSS
jgi:hypothetical protein